MDGTDDETGCNKATERLPDYTCSPGDYLAEWQYHEGMDTKTLARTIGTDITELEGILAGKRPLAHDTAIALAAVTGVPAIVWDRHETAYRDDLAHMGGQGQGQG